MAKEPKLSRCRAARHLVTAGPSKNTSKNTSTSEPRQILRIPEESNEILLHVVFFPLTKEYDDDDDIQDNRTTLKGRWQEIVLSFNRKFILADIRSKLVGAGFVGPNDEPVRAHNAKIWKVIISIIPYL